MRYDVFQNDRIVGSVQVLEKGLYFELNCTCRLGNGINRLYAKTKNGDVLIGVCCPAGSCSQVRKSIPRKTLAGELRFYIQGEVKSSGRFLPVSPVQPFAALTELEHASFAVVDGEPGLLLKDQSVG